MKHDGTVEQFAYDLLRCWANRPITTDQEVQSILIRLFDFLKVKDGQKFYEVFREGQREGH